MERTLENKLTDRRNFLKISGSSLAAGSLGALTYTGCKSTQYESKIQPKPAVKTENQYTLNDFKQALGSERLEGMTKEENKLLEKLWKELDKEGKEFTYSAYADPNRFHQLLLEFNEPDGQYFKEEFDPRKIDKKHLDLYEERTPWKLIPEDNKYTESDKAMIYLLDSLQKLRVRTDFKPTL